MNTDKPFPVGAPLRAGATALAAGLLFFSSSAAVCSAAPTTAATRGMVASGHPTATEAGLNVLKNGGNAIDATVAVALTLGVVDGDNAGLGGGCFLLIRRANGAIVAIDGREIAPRAATRDMFLRNGKGDTTLSQTGPLASGVPGALAAYEYAVNHFGKKTLRDLLLPAAEVAANGFKVDASYANRLKAVATDMAQFECSRAVFFRDGRPLGQGEMLKQPELADTYRNLAEHGSAWFYRGPFADAVAKWMKSNGGIMTVEDFRDYKIQLRDPLRTTYREYDIMGFPPPSSGGVHVAEILNILENFDLRNMDEATRTHTIAEAMKLAFADRAYWLGDPDFAKVPRGLVDKSYAKTLAGRIRPDVVAEVASHGVPPNTGTDVFRKHTTHFSVADSEGNWVACTATVNTGFGSKVVIRGVVMNDEMDDFSIQPGVANYFGLIGAEANAVAPGKRPLSSMSPTIVLKHGQPIISVGAAGGPKIISQVALALINILDLGMGPQDAIDKPRIHHQWAPDELMCDKDLPPEIQAALKSRGHKILEVNGMGISQIVSRAPDGRGFLGAADPRGHGSAEGW